mmetsp:Transcript_66627/g.138888  ORF Transcript_66627/g.138888 Transcript_66627/m.138888 type:complete len:248 (+) Transcript_66627:469-1212(+)
MGFHRTGGEEELWSHHWFFSHPGIHRFMSFKDHQAMKAAVHFQDEEESCDNPLNPNRPLPGKIGHLMEIIRERCRSLVHPAMKMAFNEVAYLMAGVSKYKHIMHRKPIHEGLMFWAMGMSQDGEQYLWDFDLDHNDGESHKIFKAVMQLMGMLPDFEYLRLYFDNLFCSVKLFNTIEAKGNYSCGTLQADRGGAAVCCDLKNPKKTPKASNPLQNKGDWRFSRKQGSNLTTYVWLDSGVCLFLSNFH